MNRTRIEIVGNNSLLEDLMDRLKETLGNQYWTMIPGVQGSGSQGQRLGDGVWPEVNFQLTLYLEEEKLPLVREAVREVKKYFPDEGLKMWSSSWTEEA